MLINELAKRTGVTIHTIRFYERYGLIRGHRDPSVTSNNYFHYGEDSVARLELILDAKSAGFSLQEIGEIIDAWYEDTCTKRELSPCEFIYLLGVYGKDCGQAWHTSKTTKEV